MLLQPLALRRDCSAGLYELRRRERFVGPRDGRNEFLLVVGENECLLPAARRGHVELALVAGREGLARLADDNLVYRFALAGMARHDIAVRQVAEVAGDYPVAVDDDIAPGGETL